MLVADLAPGEEGTLAGSIVGGVASRIDHELAVPFRLRVGELSLRASIGWGVFPFEGDDAVSLLRRADEAMYTQKRARSNRPIPLRRLA